MRFRLAPDGLHLTLGDADLRTERDVAAFLSTHADLSLEEYRALGAASVVMAALSYGDRGTANANGLLKVVDATYMPLHGERTARAFSEGENEASSRLSNVPPRSRRVERYVTELDRRYGG